MAGLFREAITVVGIPIYTFIRKTACCWLNCGYDGEKNRCSRENSSPLCSQDNNFHNMYETNIKLNLRENL